MLVWESQKSGSGESRHLMGPWLEGREKENRNGAKRRFRIGAVRRNKRYSIPSPFLTRLDLSTSFSFAFRRTLQATMLRLARLDGSVATKEEGTWGDAGDARMKGLYFHINDFMTASFHPRGRGRGERGRTVAIATADVGSPQEIYILLRVKFLLFIRV